MALTLTPYHGVRDTEKLAGLVDSMAAHGWVGGPVVIDGEVDALTGSHRIAAAAIVNDRWESGEDVCPVAVATIDIRDLFADAGLDYDALYEDEDGDLPAIVRQLPETIREEYGIDLH